MAGGEGISVLLKLIAAGIAAAVMLVIMWLVRGAMLTPVPIGKNAHAEVRIGVSGNCPELEQSVDAVLWLRENGTLRADVTVCDEGMDAQTRLAAELLAKKGIIKLISEGNE